MKKLYYFVLLTATFSNVFSQAPVITVSPASLDSFYSTRNNPSQVKSYTVQGSNLTSDIVIFGGAPDNFFNLAVSLTPGSFSPAPINLTPVSGVVPPTTIYIRLHSAYLGSVWDVVTHNTTGSPEVYAYGSGFVTATEPTVKSSIGFGLPTNNSITVNLTGGNGNARILFVRENAPVNVLPVDGHGYNDGSGVYGVANTQVGAGNYVAYKGTANTVVVTGLTAGKTYRFAVFDYNKIYGAHYPPHPLNYSEDETENYLPDADTGSASTLISGPLPILINYFTGARQNGKNLLNWKVTCISTPRVTLSLERSSDSRNFVNINSITVDAVRCNQPFDYTDTDPLKGINYYRLKMTDADGAISYSSIVALLNAAKGFDIISLAPNPVVNDNLNLNIASAQAVKMEVAIYDMQGRIISKQTMPLIAGFSSLPVNVTTFSPGTYTLKASIGDEQSKVMRFVKQ